MDSTSDEEISVEPTLEDQNQVDPTPLEQIKELLADIQTGIATLSDDDLDRLKDKLQEVKDKLQVVKDLLSPPPPPPPSGMGGRRRSAKKRGTQRKQKRRQRRGSRRAY
jgi:hypothetical protein